MQALYERRLLELVEKCPKENLIIMGGCALNCVANSKIKNKNIWIMPSPGDAGSALGAAALVHKKKLEWKHPYLGHNIMSEITCEIGGQQIDKHYSHWLNAYMELTQHNDNGILPVLSNTGAGDTKFRAGTTLGLGTGIEMSQPPTNFQRMAYPHVPHNVPLLVYC